MPSASSTPKRSAQKMRLPDNFMPDRFTVICGRGKLCSDSPGNRHCRELLKGVLDTYSNAKSKAEKSDIVSAIINIIRDSSPYGVAFVKETESPDGRSEWWEVDDSFAREKIGCMFRDMLHTQYKSSTKSKHARKKKEAAPSSARGGPGPKKERQAPKKKQPRQTKKSTAPRRTVSPSTSPFKNAPMNGTRNLSPTVGGLNIPDCTPSSSCSSSASFCQTGMQGGYATVSTKKSNDLMMMSFLQMKKAGDVFSFDHHQTSNTMSSWLQPTGPDATTSSNMMNCNGGFVPNPWLLQQQQQEQMKPTIPLYPTTTTTTTTTTGNRPSSSWTIVDEACQIVNGNIDNNREDCFKDDPRDLPYGHLTSIFD